MGNRRAGEDGAGRALSVSEITSLIKETLQTGFAGVYVVGEVSQFTRAASGHVYLTLKDEGAVLRAVIWRGVASRLKFDLAEGMEVLARGDIDVYAPRGSYQLIISWLEPRGEGARQLALRRLMERLEKEGLFDPALKKPLPPFPRRIGVVTSPTGAAIRDIINVIARRFPAVELYLYPSRVQGEGAAAEIAAAVARLNAQRPDLDLMIVGRGGGSLEDLWAFNEEAVARAVFESRIPVVSAVGHEIDFSVCDFVADVRAATPTEAAEVVVPDREELTVRTGQLRRRLGLALRNLAARGRRRLEAVASRPAFRRPTAPLREKAQRVDDGLERMQLALRHRLELVHEAVNGSRARLEALSPARVLERGYSVTLDPAGRVLKCATDIHPDDMLETRLHRGTVLSRVVEAHDARDG
jgi:exodeoxyribonuclease VII large subunit